MSNHDISNPPHPPLLKGGWGDYSFIKGKDNTLKNDKSH